MHRRVKVPRLVSMAREGKGGAKLIERAFAGDEKTSAVQFCNKRRSVSCCVCVSDVLELINVRQRVNVL